MSELRFLYVLVNLGDKKRRRAAPKRKAAASNGDGEGTRTCLCYMELTMSFHVDYVNTHRCQKCFVADCVHVGDVRFVCMGPALSKESTEIGAHGCRKLLTATISFLAP